MEDVGSAPTVAGVPLAPSTPPSVVANRYTITGLLGAGGMGRVYRAHDRSLDEVVALKVLRRELAALPGTLERFRQEVKLARRVTSPHVVRTYDLGEHGARVGRQRQRHQRRIRQRYRQRYRRRSR